ncbi:MAG: carboxypeptidase M32 [Clostridia bacterium]|nr:carboxypeptidase M32 [Clostridia bacterium]MBQ4623655.1 carboxypeptidase M32 [Clostridia bacterium]
MELNQALEKLREIEKKQIAYSHATGLIYYDGVTAAPRGTAANRGETLAILSEVEYDLSTGPEISEVVETLKAHLDELDPTTRRIVEVKDKSLRELRKIPVEEYVAYSRLTNEAQEVWHRAKEENDYASFAPYIDKLVAANKRFASLIAPEKDPYDYMLDQYEEGLTREKCEAFFGELRQELVPLVKKVIAAPQVDDSLNKKLYPIPLQEKLSDKLMEMLGMDRDHSTIATTEHPFTINFTKYDVRITTHYHEDMFLSSLYSVVHEGGHALYELGIGDDIAYTCLGTGVSMGVHESQSRFYENIIGRSEAFSEKLFPILTELFPEQTAGYTAHDLYLAANKSEPSLIRTEADELTYCLHIMVRYEAEKALFEGRATSADLPKLWNDLYKEYLGIDVPDDRQGVLQDSHWSGGSFGYFPSYAIGSAYGAQILAKMEEDFDVFEAVRDDEMAKINAWLEEHIWKYGCLYKPGELMERVFGEPFDTKYFVEYLKKKYAAIYGIEA